MILGGFYFTWKMIFKDSIYLFLERRREREKKKGENHQCETEATIGCLSHVPRPGQTHNPDMRPDWKSNQGAFHLVEQCPTNWATHVKAENDFLKIII